MFVRIYTFINATKRISCSAHEIIFRFLCISCILSRGFSFLNFLQIKKSKVCNKGSLERTAKSFVSRRTSINRVTRKIKLRNSQKAEFVGSASERLDSIKARIGNKSEAEGRGCIIYRHPFHYTKR